MSTTPTGKNGYSPVSPHFPPHSFTEEQQQQQSPPPPHPDDPFAVPAIPTYPPTAFSTHSTTSLMTSTADEHVRRIQLQDTRPVTYDPERAQTMPNPERSEKVPGMPMPERPGNRRTTSWDLLNQMKTNLNAYEEFDSRNASEAHLAFAEGDVPKNKVSKLYYYLLNLSIITRWTLFIVPVLALLWIPGILNLTTYPKANIWNVKLLWWSIWLSVVWVGWWAALALSRIIPTIIRWTIGLVAVGTRRYIDWLEVLNRYVALFGWTLLIWITWGVLINQHQGDGTSNSSRAAVDLIAKLLFGFFLCSAVLLFEKFAIQWIASKFHERSYAERIAEQKFAVRSLVTLYRHSSDIPGRSDTLHAPSKSTAPKFFKKALKGFKTAATTTTTAFGNVASEIAGSSVLQPNSPQAVIKVTLESANKSRLLARRLFYSFAKPGSEYLYLSDIARYFQSMEEAQRVYALFDKDFNDDVSRDEVEMSCVELHREQLAIEHSMRDLDSAVGRLDNIFMSVYFVVAALIVAVVLEAQLVSLVTGAGTLILGLSWLIGASLQEVLTSIIFLFIKHPFDVGDRVVLEGVTYNIKEIRLLSTIMVDSSGCCVQAPNNNLNSLFIHNMRRSGQMSEPFTFDVSYSTTFELIERLREKMIKFLEGERRDFLPQFDVSVVDFPDQEKMTLTADIKYKSNNQNGALKAKRRNKWICALKSILGEVGIYGPGGNPDGPPSTARYTQIPWEEFKAMERGSPMPRSPILPRPAGGWRLSDAHAVGDGADNVFDESEEMSMPNPQRGHSGSTVPTLRSRGNTPPMPAVLTMPQANSSAVNRGEAYEMRPRA